MLPQSHIPDVLEIRSNGTLRAFQGSWSRVMTTPAPTLKGVAEASHGPIALMIEQLMD
jgi:hypothetical protein